MALDKASNVPVQTPANFLGVRGADDWSKQGHDDGFHQIPKRRSPEYDHILTCPPPPGCTRMPRGPVTANRERDPGTGDGVGDDTGLCSAAAVVDVWTVVKPPNALGPPCPKRPLPPFTTFRRARRQTSRGQGPPSTPDLDDGKDDSGRAQRDEPGVQSLSRAESHDAAPPLREDEQTGPLVAARCVIRHGATSVSACLGPDKKNGGRRACGGGRGLGRQGGARIIGRGGSLPASRRKVF
ncbi:hypothetical protein CDD83_6993 [Cordyceps sp. RAO-2017]|nr:hypothetical protein CDD83_6993 [Cordyceps sp. RAO-2017]